MLCRAHLCPCPSLISIKSSLYTSSPCYSTFSSGFTFIPFVLIKNNAPLLPNNQSVLIQSTHFYTLIHHIHHTSHISHSTSTNSIYLHFLTPPSQTHPTFSHLHSSTLQFNHTTHTNSLFPINHNPTTSLPITYNHINLPHLLYPISNTYPSTQPYSKQSPSHLFLFISTSLPI